MARGERSEHSPNRQVGPHRWRGLGVWQVSDPRLGSLTSTANYDMEGDEGIEMGAWRGEHGHTAEVRRHYLESQGTGRRPELEEENFTAGPFKSEMRAQIAAGGLARRVNRGRAEEYR